MLNVNNADVYTDFNGLANLKNQARKDSPEALKEVAKQFEAIFLGNILKGMREAKLADGIADSDQSKFYNDMYDQQLAVHLSGKPGVGLADLIVKQLSHGESPPANEKPALADYLNRSAAALNTLSQHVGYASRTSTEQKVRDAYPTTTTDGQVIINAYIHDSSPLNAMTEIR